MFYLPVLVLILIIGRGECLDCFQCKEATKPSDCTTRVTCPSDSHCHIRKYFLGGKELYDMDCKTISICTNQEVDDAVISPNQDEVDDTGFQLWSVCCHQDFCSQNIDEKGKVIPHNQKTIECFTCPSVDDPSTCTTKQMCAPGEECITNEHIGELGKSAYHMACIPKPICDNVLKNVANDGPSKRKTLCTGCCDTDRCNDMLCSSGPAVTSSAPMVTTKAMQPTKAATTVTTSTVRPTYNEQSLYHLKVTPATVTANIGSTVVFDCFFDMQVLTSMTVTWYFIDLTGRKHELYTADKQNPELKYAIPAIESTDAGVYECEVKHGASRWIAEAVLLV